MATSSRFATINKEEFQKLIKDKDAQSTQRSTEVGVKIFKQYLNLKERLYDPEFEKYSKVQLADVLEQFYVEVRKEKGGEYKTGSLINIRAAINRHLKTTGHNINIFNEPEFTQANIAFSAKQAELKREGFGDTKSYPPMDENDIEKLYTSGIFDLDSPSGLQSKVWFELMLFICRRGRENLRKLQKDHFAIAEDSHGRKYVYQSKDEMTKRIRGDNMKSRVDGGRMYETGGERCPVASFQKYVSKLNPECDAFFQAPLRNVANPESHWYKNAPVGEKSLGKFMAKLSEAAGLSKRYTNHSLRATCITLLDECGFASRDIMNVSGHRNERSIRSYIGRPNDNKKQKLSDALSTSIGYVPPAPLSSRNVSTSKIAPPSTISAPPPLRTVDPAPSTSGNNASKIAAPHTVTAPPIDQAQPSSANSASSQDDHDDLLNFDILPLTSSQMETLEELTTIESVLSQTDQPRTSAVAQPAPTQLTTVQHSESRLIQRQIQGNPATPFTFQNCNVTINYYQK